MLVGFEANLPKGSRVASPWNENLFKVQKQSPLLNQPQAELFHTVVAQGLFLTKRARPDIAPAIAFLTTRVKSPNQVDWDKLVRVMIFLQQTESEVLTLRTDGTGDLRWYTDALFPGMLMT